LLDHDALFQPAQSGPTIGFGHGQVQQAQLLRPLEQGAREPFGAVILGGDGADLAVRKRVRQVADHALLCA
jgi:hypothetical protein